MKGKSTTVQQQKEALALQVPPHIIRSPDRDGLLRIVHLLQELQPQNAAKGEAARCSTSSGRGPGPWRNPARSALKLAITPEIAKQKLGGKAARRLSQPRALLCTPALDRCQLSRAKSPPPAMHQPTPTASEIEAPQAGEACQFAAGKFEGSAFACEPCLAAQASGTSFSSCGRARIQSQSSESEA